MNSSVIHSELERLKPEFSGLIACDELTRNAYATDASVYQQQPIAVTFPKTAEDIRQLIEAARRLNAGLIPRTAGTSLAGQVVGPGIVVDVSRFMNQIVEVNATERLARVQPGVVRDDLNRHLADSKLFFAPETATSNRAMIGGMLGNNSCGANSIVYGTTRENVISVTGWLASGQLATFGPDDTAPPSSDSSDPSDDQRRKTVDAVLQLLSDAERQKAISEGFPDPDVTRRNTGYALDRVLECQPFTAAGPPMNLCRLIAGSEGTLFFATEITVRLHDLPPPCRGYYCPHFQSVEQALLATQKIMEFPVHNCELIDRLILQGARRNNEQSEKLHYFQGDPAAVLIVEVRGQSRQEAQLQLNELRRCVEQSGLAFAHPVWFDQAVRDIAELRRAGLGVVGNISGDAKPVTVIEDTAVTIADLPNYVRDVDSLLAEKYQAECVHYGHAGAGELHLRPVLNLKTKEGVFRFRQMAGDVAAIVKRYRGSLSGEHGDGRLRSELLETMLGPTNMDTLRRVKQIWDPDGIFNPGKIVDPPLLDEDFRFRQSESKDVPTVMDFSTTGGLQRAAEMCNGVGACRKSHLAGGVMCPSYMVTRSEVHSTRARANLLRQVLTDSRNQSPLVDPRLNEVMDLCLSCKACKSECPSNVDVARMKAEFQQAWNDRNGISLRRRIIANSDRINGWIAPLAPLYNLAAGTPFLSSLVNRMLGFHPRRSLPRLFRKSLRSRQPNRDDRQPATTPTGTVIMFCDEFTNRNDVPIGIAAIELLEALGYRIRFVQHVASGRAAISTGHLRKARALAETNVQVLAREIKNNDAPVVGIEPSALLTLRDEYPDLVRPELRSAARELADRALLIDEFISNEISADRVRPAAFTDREQKIRLHGHCHQRALSSLKPTIRMLQLPINYNVKLIPSGCCGMAGAFGMEREHYELSMQIGELVLFPVVRGESEETIIAAPGTSCRHQILDGTGRVALHPVQILRDALLLQ